MQLSDPALKHAYLSDKAISRQIHFSTLIKPNYTFLVQVYAVPLLSASAQFDNLRPPYVDRIDGGQNRVRRDDSDSAGEA